MHHRIKIAWAILVAVIIATALSACSETEIPKAPYPTSSKPVAQAIAKGEVIPRADIKLAPETARHPEGYTPAAPPAANPFSRFGVPALSANGARFIEGFEGFVSCPYWDAYGGVWTRGYGETEGIHSYSSCIGRSAAEANLKYRAERFYGWAIVGLHTHFTQNQIDALYSFLWNLGAGIFTGSLRTAIQHHNPYPMLAYDHAGGVVLSGLARRRRAEVALFLKAEHHKSAAQIHRERVARLHSLLSYRRHVRSYLGYHHCRAHAKPRWTHPHNHHQHLLCNAVERKGRNANKEIARLKRLGIR